MERVYKISELKPFTGTSTKSTIYDWVKAGLFPPPIRVGLASIVWPESVLQKWLDERKTIPYVPGIKRGGRPKKKQSAGKRK